ncbi:MAG: aminotransferase class V-fold PLP-dependent enzyme, partial [Verrucomicrobiae bacterium]|nr:aminotransferase class V-fold PLP-dependent enzyme [Verrucomicrobiae bacterium]
EPWTRCLAGAAAAIPGVTVRSPEAGRLANTVAFTVTGADSVTLLAALDLAGLCASGGSACSAGSLEPSHVLRAMGVPEAECNALVRLSLGRETTEAEVDRVASLLPEVIRQVRK